MFVYFDISWCSFQLLLLPPASVGDPVEVALLGVSLHYEGLPHVVRAEEEVPGEAVRES